MKLREFVAAIAALFVSPEHARAQAAHRWLGFRPAGDGSGQALNQAEAVWLDGLQSHGPG
jgi:putative ABC transport system substrate-binding protein